MISNDPIPDNATIIRVAKLEWDGEPCLVVRYVTAEGRQVDRMEWVDELDTRPDSLANYLRTTPPTERQQRA